MILCMPCYSFELAAYFSINIHIYYVQFMKEFFFISLLLHTEECIKNKLLPDLNEILASFYKMNVVFTVVYYLVDAHLPRLIYRQLN